MLYESEINFYLALSTAFNMLQNFSYTVTNNEVKINVTQRRKEYIENPMIP